MAIHLKRLLGCKLGSDVHEKIKAKVIEMQETDALQVKNYHCLKQYQLGSVQMYVSVAFSLFSLIF